jgi:dynein light chain LC8-type
MDDGNTSLRRANAAYSNSASSLTSIPVRQGISSQNYTSNPSNDYIPYRSTSSRAYVNDNEIFRSNNSGGNIRSYSYDDLINDQTRSHSSIYNSTARSNTNNPYGQQHQQQQQTTREFDYDDDLIVKSTDLSANNEQQMIELVRVAFRKYDLNNQRELAGFLKRSADRAFVSCWHCIVGRQFSSYVTHEMNGFIYLTKGPLSILLFKSGS